MDYVPSVSRIITADVARQMNPLVLAFIGDSVQTLYVRTRLAAGASEKSGMLHIKVSREICATAQADAAENLLEQFTEQEKDIYMRARNSKTRSAAKNADIIDYHKASGFEAVIGYLYLTGEHERLHYLLTHTKGEL
ncbi:MAG: ribonuclease III [Clostridia bacterium]|nr:ribonuclease III [Clostridia bacterium]